MRNFNRLFITASVSFAFLVLGSLLSLASPHSAYASPALVQFTPYSQPSGETFQATVMGDETANFVVTEQNKIIVQKSDKYWYYQVLQQGQLIPSNAKYQIQPEPEHTLTKEDMIQFQIQQKSKPSAHRSTVFSSKASSVELPLKTTLDISKPHKLLVLLVEFNDILIKSKTEDWNAKFFGSTNSVNSYYKANSHNQFYFEPAAESYVTANDGVIKVKLKYNHPNTYIPSDTLVNDAMTAADPYINFKSFDKNNDGQVTADELHIVTVIAGYEAAYGDKKPMVWGHQVSPTSSLPNRDGVKIHTGYTQFGEIQGAYIGGDAGHMATIGIIAHELGHDLGLPDLYDVSGGNYGVGGLSLMSEGSWGQGTVPNSYPGSNPVKLDAWSRAFLGFDQAAVAPEGASSLEVSSETGKIVRVNTENPDEYFLVENRQFTGSDIGLSDFISTAGLTIYHIDENVFRNSFWCVECDTHDMGIKVLEANEAYVGYSLLTDWKPEMENYDTINPNYSLDGRAHLVNDSTKPNTKLNTGTSTQIAISTNSHNSTNMTVDIVKPALPVRLKGFTSTISFDELFLPYLQYYNAVVESNITSFKLTPLLENPNDVVVVSTDMGIVTQDMGVVAATYSIPLNPGRNNISVTVSAYEVSNSSRTYNFAVIVKMPDYVPKLSSLSSSLPFTQGFSPDSMNYYTSLTNTGGYGFILLDAETSSPDAEIMIITQEGWAYPPGWGLMLSPANQGVNLFQIYVSSPLTDNISIYNVEVFYGAKIEAKLTNLVPSSPFTTPFNANKTDYIVNVDKNLTSIMLRPYMAKSLSSQTWNVKKGMDVSDNKLPLEPGVNIFTVTVGSKYSTVTKDYTVIVNRGVPGTEIKLNKTTLQLKVGSPAEAITATVLPANASVKELVWSSLDETIAKVSPTGKVTAVSEGSTTIYVYTTDGLLKGAASVSVTVPVISIKFEKTKGTLKLSQGTLPMAVPTFNPDNATTKDLTWSSSNPKVATVDANGLVRALISGTTTITAVSKDGAKKAQFALTVPYDVASLTVAINKYTLKTKQAPIKLVTKLMPANATDKTILWSSSNDSVATVTYGSVKPIAVGTAVITATSADGGYTALTTITVVEPVVSIAINSMTDLLIIGQDMPLATTFNPTGATNQKVKWASSAPKIATVSSTGVVHAVSSGTAIITVTTEDGNKPARITIKVAYEVTSVTLTPKTSSLKINKTLTLKAAVVPSAVVDKAITWSTSNPAIATVDEAGLVTAISEGSVTITAKSHKDPNMKNEMVLTVTK